MERQVFLATWKDIPQQNESTYVINGPGALGADAIQAKLEAASVFNVAKRNVEGQDMLYNSFKLTNGIWSVLLTCFKYTMAYFNVLAMIYTVTTKN